MKGLTLDKVIVFLKVHLTFACCWPVPRDATKSQIVRNKLFRLFSCLHGLLLIVELIYTIVYRNDNIHTFMQSTGSMLIILEIPLQISLYTLQHDRLQIVICQMEDYYKQAIPTEKDLIQKYINKYIHFYTTIMIMITILTFITIIEPVFNELNSFPLLIKYPFPVDKQPLKAIIYFHHTFGVYQIYCQTGSNVFLALLIWFSSARFEILSNKFRTIAKYSDWQKCALEHQKVLKFSKEMSLSISYILLASIGISTMCLTFGGVILLCRLPLSIKVEFLITCLASLTKVFLCAWPGDYLMTASSDIADVAYDRLWYEHGIESQKILLYLLLRSQQPIIITVPGLLTALNFQYFASYISTSFSFLTTFRLFLYQDDAEY